MDFLTEVDKLVQLIECPIFTCKGTASGGLGCSGVQPHSEQGGRVGEGGHPRNALERQECRAASTVRAEETRWRSAGTRGTRMWGLPVGLRVGLTDTPAWKAKPTLRLTSSLPGRTGAGLSGRRGAVVPELSWPLPPGRNRGALAHLQALPCAREPHTRLPQSGLALAGSRWAGTV